MKQRNCMEKIVFNSSKIKEFADFITENNNRLINILDKMEKDSDTYSEMVDSKAGNLYKEVMLRELEKEKKKILENNEVIVNKFIYASQKYDEFSENIKERLSGNK